MSEQDNGQVPILQRPTIHDPEAWKAYWEAQGWTWRTEPEIDTERQKYLAERRDIVPNIKQGIYPFKNVKLSRADIEWLLATHERGRGPVDWSDESQRGRRGLDLRGADMSHIDLLHLPLTHLRCGLSKDEQQRATEEQCFMARAHMEWVILDGSELQEAYLHNIWLENASLVGAQLHGADLTDAKLQETNLTEAQLQQADLGRARLQETILYKTQLRGAIFRNARLDGADLDEAQVGEADFREAKLNGASLRNVALGSQQHIGPLLADVQWTEVNLARVNWSQGMMLGDEQMSRQKKANREEKTRKQQFLEYESAVRANRQLAVALQSQGLNEMGAHFAYRAQKLQRVVLRHQKKFGQYLFSSFLDLLAGYGYRPGRSMVWYLVTIFGFALAYFAIGHLPFFPDAFVFSLTSFHGRGFFPGLGSENSLHNPLVILAAFEAVIGLLIEISFIATFTQRFFGR